jgi:hypothetical protein
VIDLAEHGVRLKPGAAYEWVVAVVNDPQRRARDTVAGAYVRVVRPSPELESNLRAKNGDPMQRAMAYASGSSAEPEFGSQGIWYDALADAARALAARPDADDPRNLWGSLIEEVARARDEAR